MLEDINVLLAGYARELASANQKGDSDTAAAVEAEIARLRALLPDIPTPGDAETVVVEPAPETAVAEPAPEAWVPPVLETTQA